MTSENTIEPRIAHSFVVAASRYARPGYGTTMFFRLPFFAGVASVMVFAMAFGLCAEAADGAGSVDAIATNVNGPAEIVDAQHLYDDGDFVDAGAAASAEGGADAQALAAKAYASAAVLARDAGTVRRLTSQARARGEAAVALDPHHVQGRLYLSVALWLEGRQRGGFDAYFRGLPQRARRLIEGVIADAPDEPWGHAMLAAWHFEVLRRGGSFGQRMLGADLQAGAQAFDRAFALDPDDVGIAVQCAISYLALDADLYEEHARVALERALAAPPRDAFEVALQERAREAQALLDAGDRAALDAAVLVWVNG